MTKSTETGHAKNVANFENMLNLVISYNGDYKPTRDAINIQSLQTLLIASKNAMEQVSNALVPYKISVTERENAFKPLNPLVTRLVNSLSALATDSTISKAAKSLARKISGQRAKAIKKTPTVEGKTDEDKTKHNSSAQTGFDNTIENFHNLILLHENLPQFMPNEEDLQPQSLNQYLGVLKNKNEIARLSIINLDNARTARNKVLYQTTTGMFDIAADVKKYVKSVYGASSSQFKQISKIKFRKIK